MKILMVSIPSLHFFRWTSQLQDSGHQVYWFDITGMSAKVERLSWVSQKTGWKLKWNYPGRVFIKNKFPGIYRRIQKNNEKDTAKVFEDYLNEIKPDVVHSFSIQISSLPILEVMERQSHLKWIYSSWGSDIFNKEGKNNFDADLKHLFSRVNYMFADNQRDFDIAKEFGFKGINLGVFPGGGGYDLKLINKFSVPLEKRKTILIKGYEGDLGRSIPVLKAILDIKHLLHDFEIVIFGAHQKVFEFVQNSELGSWKNLKIHDVISHHEVLSLMGNAKLYVGNSISDGMPNTLLEAILSGVFPIQSNPGGVTEEIINDRFNGRLILNPNDIEHIKNIIIETLKKEDINVGITYNLNVVSPKLEMNYIAAKVKNAYTQLEK